MNAARIVFVSLALAALATFPAAAPAASLVPPGNSAANQYTETFPTSGGNAEAKGKGKVTAGDVLGAGNAKKLDSQGKQGREAAAVVAATAPPSALVPGDSGAGESESSTGGGAGKGSKGDNGGQTGGNDGAPAGDRSAAGSGATVSADESGSSGFSEVLGQATGSTSSGGTGLLLPLVVLASVIWALAFFLRRKRRTA